MLLPLSSLDRPRPYHGAPPGARGGQALPSLWAMVSLSRRVAVSLSRRVAVLGLVLLACGDEDRPGLLGSGRAIPGCEEFEYRTCDILTGPCQRELFALTACLYGQAELGEPPPVRLLDEQSAVALVAQSAAGTATGQGAAMTEGADMAEGFDMMALPEDEQAFRAEVRGLELLGLLEPQLIEDESDVLEVSVSGLLAFYLVPTREIVIIDRGEPLADLEANGILAHEYVHALQDLRHDLGAFGADLPPESDADLARSSLVEGEASLYQYLLLFAYQGADLGRFEFGGFFADLAELGLGLSAEAGSPAITARGIFPYTFGARYAGERWLSGGSRELDAAYLTPPRTSWEVLATSPGQEPARAAAFSEPPGAIEGYSLVSQDVPGAWMCAAMLAGLGLSEDELSELPELASLWQGDRIWIYAAPAAGSVAALWAIEWADAAAAARFAELALGLSPPGGQLRVDTAGTSTRITAVERAEDLDAWAERLGAVAP